jgi:hypothetical protein
LAPKEYFERELGKRKCRKVLDYLTAGLWRTDDRSFYFTVPQEADGRCDENSQRDILNELQARKR